MGTINCVYETPCGWCSKWDKKCDRKAGCTPRGKRAELGIYDDYQPKKSKLKQPLDKDSNIQPIR